MDVIHKPYSASRLIGQNIIVKTLDGDSIFGMLLSINPNSIVVKKDNTNLIIANVAIDSIHQSIRSAS